MNTAERRGEILKILHNADAPVAARELAGRFGVSRQVIVQDLAVIRASTPGILSTTKGYVIQQDSSFTREFKVRHSQDKLSCRDTGLARRDTESCIGSLSPSGRTSLYTPFRFPVRTSQTADRARAYVFVPG